MSMKYVIDNPKPFAEHADKAFKSVTSLYLPAKDFSIKPEDIKVFPRIKDNLQTQMIERLLNGKNVPYLAVFQNGYQ